LCQDVHAPNQLVAVKVLPQLPDDSPLIERFYREAKAANRIRSPYVVNAFDIIIDDGLFAFSMEYVDGRTLESCLNEVACPTLSFVTQALHAIALGLDAIHSEGLVHRDLKPSNVLVTRDLQFKIGDFGIVHGFERSREKRVSEGLHSLFGMPEVQPERRLTKSGQLLGTVDYLSPEYLMHDKVDARADIYALGTLAFEMLVGHVPFNQGTSWQRLEARLDQAAPELSCIRPDCPTGLSDLIMDCLERDPSRRPQSAREFHERLTSRCAERPRTHYSSW
jgi:serine/threonine-protein kinase